MDLIALRVAAAFYFAATVAALVGVAGRHDVPGRILRWLLGLGLASHVLSLAMETVVAGTVPVVDLGEALSVLAVLLVAVFLVVQLRAPLVALASVVAPLAFGLAFVAIALKGGV